MKKKIKDLTLEEKEKICGAYSSCFRCPLRLANDNLGGFRCVYERR